MSIDLTNIRNNFPILSEKVNGKPLIYFDNAATTQKPNAVIDCVSNYYKHYNSNIHRGVHFLSGYCTDEYEIARQIISDYLGSNEKNEIIFTAGATDSINLVAYTWGKANIKENDHVIVTAMEHHANFVPWQQLCLQKGAILDIIPLTETGELNIEAYSKLLEHKPKLVALNHVSNVLGTINDVKVLTSLAHSAGAVVLIDGAQAAPHGPLNVCDIDCDFYVFSGHKLYGPTGIGVLYGKRLLLETMPPFRYGGDMVDQVSFDKTTFNTLPFKFEAGTTAYIEAIALAAGISYLNTIGWHNIKTQESALALYGYEQLSSLSWLKVIGPIHRVPLFSIIFNSIHPFDAGTLLDKMGIAVRTGTQCAQPLLSLYNVKSVLRASLAFYNTKEEFDIFVKALDKVKTMLE